MPHVRLSVSVSLQALVALFRLNARVPRTWVDKLAAVRRVVDAARYAEVSEEVQSGFRERAEEFAADRQAYDEYSSATREMLAQMHSQSQDLATWLQSLRTTAV
jgi:hypothetical protein